MMFLFFLISLAFSEIIITIPPWYKIGLDGKNLFIVYLDKTDEDWEACYNLGQYSVKLKYTSSASDPLQASIFDSAYLCTDNSSRRSLTVSSCGDIYYSMDHYYKITAENNGVTTHFYPTNEWAAGAKYANTQNGVSHCSMHNDKGSWILKDGYEYFNGYLEIGKGSITNIEFVKGTKPTYKNSYTMGDQNIFHKVTEEEYNQVSIVEGKYIVEHLCGDTNAEHLNLYSCQSMFSCKRIKVRSFDDKNSVTSNSDQLYQAYWCGSEGGCDSSNGRIAFKIQDVGDTAVIAVENTIMKVKNEDLQKTQEYVDLIYGKYKDKHVYINEEGDFFYLDTPFFRINTVYLYAKADKTHIEYETEIFYIDGSFYKYCHSQRVGSKSLSYEFVSVLKCKDKACDEVEKIAFLEEYSAQETPISDPDLVVFSHPSEVHCHSDSYNRDYIRKAIIGEGGKYYGNSYNIRSNDYIDMPGDIYYCDDECYSGSSTDMPHKQYFYFHCGTIGTTLLALLLVIIFLF